MQKLHFWQVSVYRSVASGVWTTTAMVDSTVYEPVPHSSECAFVISSMDSHDEQKRRERNLIVCGRKSELELALDILYCWSCWQTQHRVASATAGLCVVVFYLMFLHVWSKEENCTMNIWRVYSWCNWAKMIQIWLKFLKVDGCPLCVVWWLTHQNMSCTQFKDL